MAGKGETMARSSDRKRPVQGPCARICMCVLLACALGAALPARAWAAGVQAETEIGVVFVEEPEAPSGEGEPGQEGQPQPGEELTFVLVPTGDAAVGMPCAAGAAAALALVGALAARRRANAGKGARHGR